MTDSSWWPTDYFASRNQFIKLARGCGARLYSHPIDAVGPRGKPLTVDVADFTSPHDEHRIVLTSGVHGVEGYIGACIQIQALQMLARNGIPERIGIVMIHAVNPWGFAHLRRVDENNVDVNRNFLDSSVPQPLSHPQYAALDPVINPQSAPAASGEITYWLNASKLIIRNRGITKLFKPIAEGQYDFPQGLFFGGKAVGESCELLQSLVRSVSADVDQLTLLDLHSGLGPSATATLIGNSNVVTPEECLNELRKHYRLPVYVDNASSNVYNAQGTFAQWCQYTLSNKSVLYLCVEIGTVNPVKLFSALRRENQAHHWSAKGSRPYVQTKKALLQVFAPRSKHWRTKSVAQGLHVLVKTFDLPDGFRGGDR